jgi:hypothetical protein
MSTRSRYVATAGAPVRPGWWLPPKYGGDTNPLANLPLTAQAQRRLGESITGLR